MKDIIEEFIERQRDFLERFTEKETILNLQWNIKYWRQVLGELDAKENDCVTEEKA